MRTIVFCYTIANTFHFSKEIIGALKDKGYKIVLISSRVEKLKYIAEELDVDYRLLDLQRSFTPLKDFRNLIKLFLIFKRIKPDIVVGATPKAALTAMIAGLFAGVKHRVYHIFGLTFETAEGLKRKALLFIEKITHVFASDVVCISNSVCDVYCSEFPSVAKKIRDVGLLSVGGVDLAKFDKKKFDAVTIKESLGISGKRLVIGFVARLTIDKGLDDLIEMWHCLKKKRKDVTLFIIGERDSRIGFNQDKLKAFFDDEGVYYQGLTHEVEKYMAMMDVFVLPSYREGFGNVIAEASAMGIPVVSYNVTGCKDSVKNGHTGILVEKKNVLALCNSVNFLLENPAERKSCGESGRQYIAQNFTRKKVAEQFAQFCGQLS